MTTNRTTRVDTYFPAGVRDQPRWRVLQEFPKSAITEGHSTVLRHNFTTRESAQRYADRVERVGFEYA